MMSLRSKKTAKRVADTVVVILLSVFSITMVLPLVWMISTSLKTPIQTRTSTPQWIPDPVVWTKYVEIWEKAPLLLGFLNSAIYAVVVLAFGTFFTAAGAFAFSKMRFPGRDIIFLTLLGTMMIPFPALMIPHYVLFVKLGWIDTLLPLIIPQMLGHVFMMFFLRQYMNGIPDEMIEAAKIDGAGYFGILVRIMFPLIKPAVAAQVILWLMSIWKRLCRTAHLFAYTAEADVAAHDRQFQRLLRNPKRFSADHGSILGIHDSPFRHLLCIPAAFYQFCSLCRYQRVI